MSQRLRTLTFAPTLLLLAACGSSTPPQPAAPQTTATAATATPKEENPDEKPITALPTECERKDDGVCLPPANFAKRLCGGFFPDVALSMFAKGTPWTRAYLRRDVEAWNASGGVSSSDKLVFDEEVLILVQRKPDTGGMTVSGASGSLDVLRWDGTCASLMGEEVTTRTPPAAKYAKIPWKSLSDDIQHALMADEKISDTVITRKKECKGATMGDVSDKCVKADVKMSKVIVDYVRKGGAIPAPTRLP